MVKFRGIPQWILGCQQKWNSTMDFHNGIPQCTVGEGLLRQNAIISSKDLQQKVEIRQKMEIHKKGNPQKMEIRQKREFHNWGIPQ